MSFPKCDYSGRELEPGLRECHSPQLVGLKVVAPELCESCVFRQEKPLPDHCVSDDRVATSNLFPCAFRGELQDQHGEDVYGCRHADHEYATTATCRLCPDYLFPQMVPEMPTSMAKRLLPVIDSRQQAKGWWLLENVQRAFRQSADELIRQIPPFPSDFCDRGIVIAGGGKYFVCAYVTIRVLRHVGCTLPIELWHLAGEIDNEQVSLLAEYGVTCRDAQAHPAGIDFAWHDTWWKGWQLKPFAICHSRFREVLYLDADCYPVRDPEFIFDWEPYRTTGAIFFPDLEISRGLLPSDSPAVFGVAAFEDTPAESGQLVINKEKCWRELHLTLHYNSLPEFSYRHLHGDKDTFPLAWKYLNHPYSRMWPTSTRSTHGCGILHHDFTGQVIFQHRCGDKFRLPEIQFDSNHQLNSRNLYQPEMAWEDFCFEVLDELASRANTSGDRLHSPGDSARTDDFHLAVKSPKTLRIVWDGLFHMSKSLGVVSYYTCQALQALGVEVRISAWPESDPSVSSEFLPYTGNDADAVIRFCDPYSMDLIPQFSPDVRRIAYCYFDMGLLPSDQRTLINNSSVDLWVLSPFTRQILIEQAVTRPIEVVPLGVEDVSLSPLPTRSSHKLTFIYAGETGHRKGVDILVKAFRQAFSPQEPVELIIKGWRGPASDFPEENIRNIAEILPRSEMFRLLAQAHYFVATPRMESFGLVGIEAAAVGTPMIYPYQSAFAAYANQMPHAMPLLKGQWTEGTDGGQDARHWECCPSELSRLFRWIYETGSYRKINHPAVQLASRKWSWQNTASEIVKLLSNVIDRQHQ